MTALPSYGATLELRPRRSPILRKEEMKNDSARMLVLVAALSVTLLKMVVAAINGDVGAILAPIVGIALIFGVLFFGMRRMRLRVAPASIDRIGGLPAKHVNRAEVIGVVRVPIESFRMQEGFVDLLINQQGRCLLRMRDRMWENGDLDRAWAHAGLGIQHVAQTMNYKQLEAWIPGSTKLWERRPIALAAWGTAVLVALLIAAVMITLAAGGQTAP